MAREKEEGDQEAMIPLLSEEDVAFDALLMDAQIATSHEVLEEKTDKKKEGGKVEKEKSLTDITDLSKQERLARESALKKPIMCPAPDDVSKQERLAREKALKKPIVCPDDSATKKRYGKFKREYEEEEEKENEHSFEFKNKKTRKYSDSEKPEKDVASCSKTTPDMPEKLKELITSMNGSNLAFVIQKPLSRIDISSCHNRVTIPSNPIPSNDQITKHEFLTPEEVEFLEKQKDMPITTFIEPSLEISEKVVLRQWVGRLRNNFSYVLKTGWNDVKNRNGLKENDVVQIWSFRVEGKLCFAMFKVREGVDSASGGQTSEDNNNGSSSSGSEMNARTDQIGVNVQGGSGCIGDGSGASTTSPSGEGEHNGSSSIDNGTGVGSSSQSPEGEHGGGGSDGGDMGSTIQSGIQEN